MRNLITKSALSLVLTLGAASAQEAFEADGTDFTTAKVDAWVEDQSNEIVDQVNGFACILKAARIDANANRTYEALIDEEECLGGEGEGEGEEGANSGGGNQSNAEVVEYARATISSRRPDGENQPQSVKMSFETAEGNRYHAKAEVRAAPTEDLPFGAWSFSYANGGTESSPVTALTGLNEGGFVDISTWTGTGTDDGDTGFEITTGNLEGSSLSNLNFEAGKIRYNNTDDVATFIGLKALNGGGEELVAGRAQDQYYYRWSINPDNAETGGVERCMNRNDTWSSVHQYKLFYKNDDTANGISAGDVVDLQGGFGFTYGDSDDFGWFDHWGVWFAGAFPFNADTDSVTVTNDDDLSYTINMTPGRLIKKTFVPETLAVGDAFIVWAPDGNTNEWIQYRAVYDGPDAVDNSLGTFDMTPVDGGTTLQDQTLDDQYALGYLWSPQKFVSIEWDGGLDVNIRQEENVTFDADIIDGETFVPEDTTNFATGTPYGDDETFFINGTGNNVASLDQGVLYQSSDATLDASDTSKASFSGWTQVNMIRSSDLGANCAQGSTALCPATYTWYSGSQWDFSYQAVDANNQVHDIDEPISISYTFEADDNANHDRNAFDTAYTYSTASGFYDPVNACQSDGTNCTFQPGDLNDKNYQLRYNGEWLDGLPYTFADDGGYHIYLRLINLRDGITLNPGDTTEYVVKAVAFSESIRDASSMTECSDRNLRFAATTEQRSVAAVKASFAQIGFDPDELLPFDLENPNVTTAIAAVDEYGGLPALNWKQDFDGEAATIACTITHGDNSGCE